MKKLMKITLFLFCTTLFLFPFIFSATCTTTQGDTTFGVDEGETLVWTATGGSPEIIGFKYNITIEDIYNGTYMTVDSYLIDVTMGEYNKTADKWSIWINDDFFVAANETQNFIEYTGTLSGAPLWFIIPTPINLTMLGEYAVSTGFYTDYTVSGNRIELNEIMGIGTYKLTYNSDGILTKHVTEFVGVVILVLVLGEGGGKDAIPYGYSFLIFTVIGTMALIYLVKRKTK